MPPKKAKPKSSAKRKSQSKPQSEADSKSHVETEATRTAGEKVTFETLPLKIRNKIYRLHLVSRKNLSLESHCVKVGATRSSYWGRANYAMPPIMEVSPTIEKEAAVWYYGENHFEGQLFKLLQTTAPKHLKLVRKLTMPWGDSATFGWITQLRGLRELYIRVDEKAMIEQTSSSYVMRCPMYCRKNGEPTQAQKTSVLAHSGMAGIRKLYCIPYVEFIKRVDDRQKVIEDSGPLQDGLLNGQIRKFMMSDGRLDGDKLTPKNFPFLELTPELRNRIYAVLFDQLEPITPSNRTPTSATAARLKGKEVVEVPSCLSILLASKQIHNEAYGIFYHINSFVFKQIYELQAFLIMIGPDRKRHVRDLQFTYQRYDKGWVDVTDVTLAMLPGMTALRRLVVDIRGNSRIATNLCSPPGLRRLFELRRVTDIRVTDHGMDAEVERAKKGNSSGAILEEIEKAVRAHEFFNAALQDAQEGRVNRKILEDPDWEEKEPFPAYEELEDQNIAESDQDDSAAVIEAQDIEVGENIVVAQPTQANQPPPAQPAQFAPAAARTAARSLRPRIKRQPQQEEYYDEDDLVVTRKSKRPRAESDGESEYED